MPADRSTHSPPPTYSSPIKILGTSPGSGKLHHAAIPSRSGGHHARARSSSGSSHASSSRTVPPFPTLLATPESVLEQNSGDILWKVFVAFEQDMRDCNALAPVTASIESTVASAIDPISLAGDCLAETAHYIETEIRDAIEETLASGGTLLSSSPSSINSDGSPRALLSSPVSHSKQFSLASTRLSGACSTFRATQASLRYYGGARKTAYQLDLFVHKYALPTSTALHKRGQEFSAANKWLKKMLNGDPRMLDAMEVGALRRAATTLKHWAEGLRIHSEIMKNAANSVRALMQERVSLQAYSFPARPPPLQQPLAGNSMRIGSPPVQHGLPALPGGAHGSPATVHPSILEFTNFSPGTATMGTSINTLPPAGTSSQSHGLPPLGPASSIGSSSMGGQSLPQSMQSSLPSNISSSMPMSMPHSLPNSYVQSPVQGLPQSCAFAFSTPTFVQDQSVYQQHQQQMPYQPFTIISPTLNSPDLSLPTELFFDNLCM